MDTDEYKFFKGIYLKYCNICLEKSKISRDKCKCIHNKDKSRCIECGGSGICIHNKQKSRCKECGGSEICIHHKQKSRCID